MVLRFSAMLFLLATFGAARPKVFPEPRDMRTGDGEFVLTPEVTILLPEGVREPQVRLARLLASELSGRFRHAIATEQAAQIPTGRRFILMGAATDPLVKEYCDSHGINATGASPGPEGYILTVTPQAVVIAGSDDAGAFYGLQTLRQLIMPGSGSPRIGSVEIRDWPYKRFRGVKLYLPGHENLAFFKRFVADYMALCKYNKLIVEMNAGMRLDRHPELNAGWLDFARDMRLRRLNKPPGLWFHGNNSSHYDTADGGVLEKAEVADIVRWAAANYIEVIPELPTLTHSYYLLTRHRELAEIPQEETPDTYCPSLSAVYKLVFDVYDEYIDVMRPRMIHIGHDEWRMPWGVCPRCRDKDPRELFAQDVNKIHRYLKGKGVRAAMWADHLLENARGAKLSKPWWDEHQYDYKIPGALSPEQVRQWIPKDILMFNWLWDYTDDPKFPPVTNEQRLTEWGFEQIYGNFEPSIRDFEERTRKSGIAGGAPSAWLATTEFNFGKDVIDSFTGCAGLLWSGRERTPSERSAALRALMPGIRKNLSGEEPPSTTDPHVAIDIGKYTNSDIPGGRRAVAATSAGPDTPVGARSSDWIPVGRDASSLIFLHAALKPAASVAGYESIYDFEDSAPLLGWYDVEYEDGLVTTLPLRYGWNIVDLKNPAGIVPYRADAKDEGGVTMYSFEWTNPRLGKAIKRVRLAGSSGFRNTEREMAPSNTVFLAGLDFVPKRAKPEQPDPLFPK